MKRRTEIRAVKAQPGSASGNVRRVSSKVTGWFEADADVLKELRLAFLTPAEAELPYHGVLDSALAEWLIQRSERSFLRVELGTLRDWQSALRSLAHSKLLVMR